MHILQPQPVILQLGPPVLSTTRVRHSLVRIEVRASRRVRVRALWSPARVRRPGMYRGVWAYHRAAERRVDLPLARRPCLRVNACRDWWRSWIACRRSGRPWALPPGWGTVHRRPYGILLRVHPGHGSEVLASDIAHDERSAGAGLGYADAAVCTSTSIDI